MNTTPALVRIGTLGKLLGRDGMIKCDIPEESYRGIWSRHQVVWIERMGCAVPYCIQKSTDERGILLMNVEDHELKSMQGSALYMEQNALVNAVKKDIKRSRLSSNHEGDYTILMGFHLYDKSHKHIGLVTDIVSMPGQWMATVELGDRQIYIPLTEDWILSIDHDTRNLFMDIPIGLLDIDAVDAD
jgi:ribosomal 30S subunit maturation factor RimM